MTLLRKEVHRFCFWAARVLEKLKGTVPTQRLRWERLRKAPALQSPWGKRCLFNSHLSVFQRLSRRFLHTLNLRLKISGKCFWCPSVYEGAQVDKIYGLELISSLSTGATFSIL